MIDNKEEYDAGRLSTTRGEPPKQFSAPAPDPTVGPNGQHASYWVLSESERAKGFVRPVRRSYTHLKCGSATKMGLALAETATGSSSPPLKLGTAKSCIFINMVGGPATSTRSTRSRTRRRTFAAHSSPSRRRCPAST